MQTQYTATRPTGPQAIHPPHLATDLMAIRLHADQLCVWVSLACLGFAIVQGLAYNNLAEALGWGVPLFSASYLLTRFFAGQTLTMYLNAALLVGMGALHVHVARGLLEFHFSFFMLLPVMLVIAIAVKTTSKGPVFFVQKRHGFNNEVINVLKFRSMYTEMSDPTAKNAVTKGDPRVTRFGRFLRQRRNSHPEQREKNEAGLQESGSHLCAPNYCMRYRPSARQPQDIFLGTSHVGFRTIINIKK